MAIVERTNLSIPQEQPIKYGRTLQFEDELC